MWCWCACDTEILVDECCSSHNFIFLYFTLSHSVTCWLIPFSVFNFIAFSFSLLCFFVVVVSFNFSLIQSIQTSYVKSTRMKRNKQKTPSNFVSTPKENKMKMPKNDDNLRKISWKQTKKYGWFFFHRIYQKSGTYVRTCAVLIFFYFIHNEVEGYIVCHTKKAIGNFQENTEKIFSQKNIFLRLFAKFLHFHENRIIIRIEEDWTIFPGSVRYWCGRQTANRHFAL